MATVQQLEIRVEYLQKLIRSAKKEIKADTTKAINAFVVINQRHSESDVGQKHKMLYTYHCKCAQRTLKAEIAVLLKTKKETDIEDIFLLLSIVNWIKHKRAVLRQVTRILEVEETMERIRKMRYV